MYFAIGFLAASLLGLAVAPLVHARAERLTMRRLQDTVPTSVAEMQAMGDLLRADFAMTTRRLELRIEQLTTHAAFHLAELGRTADVINKLKNIRDEQKAEILDLRAQVETLKERLALPNIEPSPSLFPSAQMRGARSTVA